MIVQPSMHGPLVQHAVAVAAVPAGEFLETLAQLVVAIVARFAAQGVHAAELVLPGWRGAIADAPAAPYTGSRTLTRRATPSS